MAKVTFTAQENAVNGLYVDGSGAPAIVHADGFAFAMNILGEIAQTLVNGSSGRKPGKRAIAVARHAYTRELAARASDEWMKANREMYA